ncbi:cytochrome c [Geomonas sp. Red32]|uniref:cytochrome c n=1 Tax=Geomonas sp. Red32 TaxID=2912856 RepID=UPI00202CC546|nr:cytochrome c [Geomonas sp. Red32]MCM0083925.1 cytochrome c [Geomonas sp. Red32]
MKKLVAFAVIAGLACAGQALGHEGEHHHHHDGKMAKTHEIMSHYATSQAKITAALEKRDAATVAKETNYLLSTGKELKSAQPHKGQNDLKKFRELAGQFQSDVKTTAALAASGDFKKAKEAFAAAQGRCTACHAQYRD